jgi:hypothetical protein
VFSWQFSVFSRKTAEPQRLAAESPLPDLDGEVFAEFVQAVLQTEKGRPSFLATAERCEP